MEMTNVVKRTLIAAVAALSIGAALAVSTGSAEAGWRHRHFGHHHFHGGYWGGGYYNVGYRRYYSDCWTEKRPRYNRFGDFRGYRYIRVCR
jgi:hypothetical protein